MDISKLKSTISTLPNPYLIILVGPPLSGKDTVLRELNLDAEMISRDQILLDVYGSDDYQEAFKNVNQKDVDRELVAKMQNANKNKQNVVINMTNMTRKRRSYNLSFFGKDFTKVAVVFPIFSNDEYKRRNEKRFKEENKFIPDHVLRNMIDSYHPVTRQEGFNRIISLG